uniref:Putative mutator sub-class protein n=1 Tax=Arachis hypogaea TaxID=3818 RepID=C0L2U2_ARAHY|nr:putative mutator sub-class protein [Arachis hypogaea]
MASEESFVVLVHHRGSIKRKTRSGVKFTDKDSLCIVVSPTTSYDDLVRSVLMKLGLEGAKRVKKFFYRIPITVLQDTVKYDCFTIGSDEDLQVMFLCRRQFPEVRTPELLAKLVDVVSSSGGSNRNTTTVATAVGSSSRPAVASSSIPVYEPAVQPVASPSFAVDLNDSVDDEVGSFDILPNALQGVPPVGVGDGLLGDAEEDDVKPDMIEDDSGDEEGVSGHSVGFGARDAEGTAGLTEFQVGQQFQDKDEALLSVKTYSIRRGVQYKVVESDYRRYVGKCSEFGNGCTWLIRLSLRQRKGIWEVKRYNGPHTCLATSISSDHRSLDYHVISAFIMPMVRADSSVSIKVLLNATTAHFRFRPTYMRVWMAKQKAIALIYGDWDESYNELPRWVLGVQLTMPGTVAVLRTSPVRVGGQVDESQAYFHRLFWTFPPCIEAFRHCKPLVSIDGTHLYGKYGGTLLIAIAQDGNSNILPVAFALVEGENAESWTFFLSHLRQHVTPQPGLLVISDRHNGIKAALEAPDGGWLPPSAYRAFCIRHVVANFALTFKGKDAQSQIMSNSNQVGSNYYWSQILSNSNQGGSNYLVRIYIDNSNKAGSNYEQVKFEPPWFELCSTLSW